MLQIAYDENAFKNFVLATMKKHGIKANADDICAMIIDRIEAEVKANRGKGKQMVFGIDDGKLEAVICKSPAYLDEWKKSKAKNEKKAKENERVIEMEDDEDDEIVDVPVKKLAKKPVAKQEKKILRKPKKNDDDFDIMQLELF